MTFDRKICRVFEGARRSIMMRVSGEGLAKNGEKRIDKNCRVSPLSLSLFLSKFSSSYPPAVNYRSRRCVIIAILIRRYSPKNSRGFSSSSRVNAMARVTEYLGDPPPFPSSSFYSRSSSRCLVVNSLLQLSKRFESRSREHKKFDANEKKREKTSQLCSPSLFLAISGS